MPRGIRGSGSAAATGATARSGTITADMPPATSISPAQSGILWKSATYRFIQQPTGLIVEMETGNSWAAVPYVPVSVLEQFLMTRGFLKPAVATALPHATNGANRASRSRTARSGTSTGGSTTAAANKTSTVSRA